MDQQFKKRSRTLTQSVAVASLLMSASAAQAMNFQFGDGDEWNLDWDTNVSYTAQWRTQNQDDGKYRYKDIGDPVGNLRRYSTLINANDGNNNFSKAMVQNKVTIVTESDLSWRNFGLFTRARAFYDDVYDKSTDQSAEDYLTYNNGFAFPNGDTAFQQFPDKTVNKHRDRIQMLDYFLYASGELPGDRLFDIRLGSQVINWGEATFTPGINGLQNRADLIARNTPGFEVKEILLPTGALYGQVDVMPGLTFEAYYQYEWQETELNGVGSFFSDRDFLGPGAKNFIIAFGPETYVSVPKTKDENASDSGQFGTALHWITDGGTDFGLYYINAHSKAPAYQLNYDASGIIPETYTIKYFEDIKGYAASFTTVMGITNVQGEVSYKENMPVVLLNGDAVKGDVISYQLGGSYVMEPTMFWDDGSLTFELAGAYIDSHDSSELTYDDNGTVLNLRLEVAYLNIVPGLDLKVPVFFKRGLDGNILESEMVEDATAVNIEFQFIYLNNFTTKFGYTTFFDGGENNLISDRDNVSVNVSYSF